MHCSRTPCDKSSASPMPPTSERPWWHWGISKHRWQACDILAYLSINHRAVGRRIGWPEPEQQTRTSPRLPAPASAPLPKQHIPLSTPRPPANLTGLTEGQPHLPQQTANIYRGRIPCLECALQRHRQSSPCSPDCTSTPTPCSCSSATAACKSPKRTVAEAMTFRERVPTLNMNVSKPDNGDGVSEAKCDSPRSKVAERLQALDIDQSEEGPRKRLKKTVATEDRDRNNETTATDMTPNRSYHQPLVLNRAKSPAVEIAETPGCKFEFARPSTPSPLAHHAESSNPANTSSKIKPSPKRMRSPPPPPQAQVSPFTLTSTSPITSPTHNPAANDATSMTWQDSEITGHEIDASLGDDGEGINGIGFRPTPAIAQARSQKRKQQVSAWRAREAKEARQRRFEKRQGCSLDASGGAEGQRRAVRFEGVG